MKVTIDENIIKKATKCSRDKSCLDSCTRDVCPVKNGKTDHSVALFIEAKQTSCDYKHAFGFGHYCDCPVRKELHQRHRI